MPIWNTDAQFAKSINDDYLFEIHKISSFLDTENNDQFIVVASKGMGKTLLLRHKRKALEKLKKGLVLIPQKQDG